MNKLNASKIILEMLKGYEVEYVFGLPGETTLPLYKEWINFPEIHHVMARDERSASFMADGYARFSFKPGICEAPSVGSTHVIPGVAEAYIASVPLIILTTDIPLHLEKRNTLTGINQTALFSGITKETITITNPIEIPNIFRRVFRVATTGRPGPVHIRLPYDILQMETKDPQLDIQKDFTKYPSQRPTAEKDKIVEAIKLLGDAERPVIVCGQGVLHSQAWDEVVAIAEYFGAPVGTTINGKGSISEIHPLSIGVIGARGGTKFSNKILIEADLIFFIGSSTDSAGTDMWNIPPPDTRAKIIQLDISGAQAGNNYPCDILLIGDAKSTLTTILEIVGDHTKLFNDLPRIKEIQKEMKKYLEYVADLASSNEEPVHPVRFIKSLTDTLPKNHGLVMDVGISAIYTSTYYKTRKAGRSLLYNFAMGSLGYAIPASIGANIARPDSCISTLVGDGSFGLTVGELETIARLGLNNNLILMNNMSFGWIRAEWKLSYGDEYVDFATKFKPVDYQKIAEGFGLKTYKITKPSQLHATLNEAFKDPDPTFIELIVKPEDELVPPVPKWIKKAEMKGVRHVK
jgi:acetolactate synthase-1/2/3 large subunit